MWFLLQSPSHCTESRVFPQLEKWQALFEKLKGEGLTSSEQQGLYGELHFLQKIIL